MNIKNHRRVPWHIILSVETLSHFFRRINCIVSTTIVSIYLKLRILFTSIFVFYQVCFILIYLLIEISFIFLGFIFILKYGESLLADSVYNNYREQEFWKHVNATCNEDEVARLKQIYSCSDRFFIYHYLAVYDIKLHVGAWKEPEIHYASLRVSPRTLIKIVDAAQMYCPEYSPNWQPPEDYLIEIKFSPWMDYAPNLFFERNYIVLALSVLFVLYVGLFWGSGDE